MPKGKLPLRQVSQMLVVQTVSALAPFLILPVVSRVATPEQWSAFVLGQTVGLFMAVVVAYGWQVAGLSLLPAAPPEHRPAIFVRSIATRISLSLVVLPLTALIVLLIPTHGQFKVTFWVAAGYVCFTGLGSAWYFTAQGKPIKMLLYGALPMAATAGASAFLVLHDVSPAIFGVLLTAAGFMSLTAVLVLEVKPGRQAWLTEVRPKAVLDSLREHGSMAASQAVSALYVALPMAAAATILPVGQAAIYASIDRGITVSNTVLGSFGNVFQTWTSQLRGGPRAHVSSIILISIGTIALIGWLVGGPAAIKLAFGDQPVPNQATCALVGLYLLLTSIRGAALRFYVVPAGRYGSALTASATGLIVLTLGILIVPSSTGQGSSIVIVLCASEFIAGLVQLRNARQVVMRDWGRN